jgi:4-hydroxy-3-methylbut-2-enyl diphosphate reductase
VDTLIVVGGHNSSNTRRLAEIGRNHGIHTLHVETEEEIDDSDLSGSEHILLTAGASTPGWIINNVLEKLYAIKQRKSLGGFQHVLSIIGFAVRANLFSSIAAGMVTHLIDQVLPVSLGPGFPLLSSAFIFFMYSINNYLDRHILKISNRYKYEIFDRYGFTLILLAVLALGYSLSFMGEHSLMVRLVFIFALFFGTLYSTGLIRKTVSSIGWVTLSKVYFSKIITGFGWLMIIWLLPILSAFPLLYSEYLFPVGALGLLLFSLVFIRHLLTDLVAYQGDLIMGRDTLPIILGRERSFSVFMVFSFMGILSSLALVFFTGQPIWAVLALPFFYEWGLFVFIRKKTYLISLKFETLVDMAFLLVYLGWFLITFM